MVSDRDITTKGKELFLGLSTITLLLMMILTTVLWWFISPRLHEINGILANISLTLLRIFYLILVLGTILVYLTSFFERNFLIAKFAVVAYIKILFPVTLFFGTLIGISKDKLRESFVYVNNSFLKALRKRFLPEKVLILLPHCLQNLDCKIRVTVDVRNCVQCGNCDIAELVRIADKYGVNIAMATGGTLARKIIIDNKPELIIAVACERDMVEGITEVFPIPVYGVLNERPEGPCVNTKVKVNKIEETLTKLLYKKK